MENVHRGSAEPIRVLFLAWGYSIHAQRRIQIFLDDPRFRVAVVSTYSYALVNARNYLLTHALQKETPDARPSGSGNGYTAQRMWKAIRPFLVRAWALFPRSSTLYLNRLRKIRGGLGTEIRIAIKDLQLLRSAVADFCPDAVFLQTLLYPSYLAYFVRPSIPLIITFWNGDITWWAKWNHLERQLKKQIVVYGVKRAKAITVNSLTALDICKNYGVQASKIHLIRYPGVDLIRFAPMDKRRARLRLGIIHRRVVLCPRGTTDYLNSDVIIDAAAKVVEDYPDTLFIFMRTTHAESGIQRTRALGIEHSFRWEETVRWEEMPTYFNASDVMVSIASQDSLPNCMLEAMACRVPVVMGDIPSIREWVIDGVNGFLVSPRDPGALAEKLVRVFMNPGSIVDEFVEKNHELVSRELDSTKCSEAIKRLVIDVARNEMG